MIKQKNNYSTPMQIVTNNQIDQDAGLTWSTEKINKYQENLDAGIKVKGLPYYEGSSLYRRGNIYFDYTNEELLEMYKCANDITYFAEKYCQIKREDGTIGPMKLREYQKDIIDLYTKNPRSILMASRQTGKCLSFNTLVNIESDGKIINSPIGLLYYDFLKKDRKLTFLEKVKILLYNILSKLS